MFDLFISRQSKVIRARFSCQQKTLNLWFTAPLNFLLKRGINAQIKHFL